VSSRDVVVVRVDIVVVGVVVVVVVAVKGGGGSRRVLPLPGGRTAGEAGRWGPVNPNANLYLDRQAPP
jgi:hypothetical protein